MADFVAKQKKVHPTSSMTVTLAKEMADKKIRIMWSDPFRRLSTAQLSDSQLTAAD